MYEPCGSNWPQIVLLLMSTTFVLIFLAQLAANRRLQERNETWAALIRSQRDEIQRLQLAATWGKIKDHS